MSANPTHQLGPADSGVLDGLCGLPPKPARLDSSQPPARAHSRDTLTGADTCGDTGGPPTPDEAAADAGVIQPAAEEAAGGQSVERVLCDVPLPSGLLARLHEALSDGTQG
ncbi:MAG: hypothetical protein AAF790_14975 [Planctomycetota bacterium]